jgi:hypothetical protein
LGPTVIKFFSDFKNKGNWLFYWYLTLKFRFRTNLNIKKKLIAIIYLKK